MSRVREMDSRGLGRILALLDRGELPAARFASLAFGPGIGGLDAPDLARLVAAFAGHHELRDTALALVTARLHHRPEDLGTLSDVASGLATDIGLILAGPTHRAYEWKDLALAMVPTHAPALAAAIFAVQQRHEGFWSFDHSPAYEVILACVKHDPDGVWAELAPILDDQDRQALFVIGFPDGLVDRLPHDVLLDWVEEDPARRACALANVVSPHFTDNALAAKLADRYGDRDDVASELYGQIIKNAGGIGSQAERCANWAATLERVAEKTSRSCLRRWARRCAGCLREWEQRERLGEVEERLES
jgi:hypothetical protein